MKRGPNKIYWFEYSDCNGRIRIKGKRKSSIHTRPSRGTWVVQELDMTQQASVDLNAGAVNYAGKWIMPCFPEITWGRLSVMKYCGKNEAK